MNPALPHSGLTDGWRSDTVRIWAPPLLAAAAMYLPVYYWAAGSIWQSDDHAHGAIVLLVVLALFWSLRRRILAAPARPQPVPGWILLAGGLLLYLAGRMFHISIFEFASQIPVAAALLLLIKGMPGLRVAWFAVLYLVFMIPLPGVFVDALTGPLKEWISDVVVRSLYFLGYPIARQGVIISIGQYQLLVADACSGLRSMFSLAALGTLFMYIMGRPSWLHNAVMVAAIVPIAVVANAVRVGVLVLITYHFGDEAGQGFLHGAAGMVMMLIALMSLFALDVLLGVFGPARRPRVSPFDS